MIEYKTITLGEFFDGIERNGLPQTVGTLYESANGSSIFPYELNEQIFRGKVAAACSIGIANINTGIFSLESLKASYGVSDIPWNNESDPRVEEYSFVEGVMDFIVDLNDNQGRTFAEIAKLAREKYVDSLDRTFTVRAFDWSPWL